MKNSNNLRNHIFRPNAVRRYLMSKEKTVLPKFVSPNTHIFLWFLLALFMASILLTWMVEIPVFASGAALVVSKKTLDQTTNDSTWFIVFLPANTLSQLQFGQNLFIHMENKRITTIIVDVEQKAISPEVVKNRFNLGPIDHSVFAKPVVVAYAPFAMAPGNLLPILYQGSIFKVDIEICTRRVITLLPVIGRFFEK